jgi:ATP-dependent Lon protease
MIEKLKRCFDDMVVFKDLRKSNLFSAVSLPSFMRDWLLKRFENEDGEYNPSELAEFIRTYLPRKDDWNAIKNRIVIENERVRFLAKVTVDIDVRTAEVSFTLPDFGLRSRETVIEQSVWNKCKDTLVKGRETWGMLELGYRPPDDSLKLEGRITLIGFKAFQPYIIDTDYFKEARKEFTVEEWIDVLLGAVDYNATGYSDENAKLTMLSRLLPFIEKRLNLIELAPKGTGKSYLFGRVSRFGWLNSGGVMSRAKMFYDIARRTEGLVAGNDFITLDEAQTITFPDDEEMRGALKGYMESGVFTVGNYQGRADASIILCGNIRQDRMDEYQNMFEELKVFYESALIDRFHGFIKGWNIPRMNDDLKVSGWALNSEYFSSILHELREDASYRAIVDALIVVPDAADTRDTEAIKRIATAWSKLLFPNVREAGEIDPDDFIRYCLRPARQMRGIIKTQLGIMDTEFRGKDVPQFEVRQ